MCKDTLLIELRNFKMNMAKYKMLKLKEKEIDRSFEQTVLSIEIALESLKEEEKQFIEKKYFEDLTIDDLAYDFDFSPTTAIRRNQNVLTKLLQIINI